MSWRAGAGHTYTHGHARHRGRRGDRHRQVRPGHRAGPGVRRRDTQRRLHAALPGHGHRHGQGARGRLAGRAAPPARHLAGDPDRERGRLPETGPRHGRRHRRPRPGPGARRWLRPVRPCRSRRSQFSPNGPRYPRSAGVRARRGGRRRAARPAGRARPGRRRRHPAQQRPPDRPRAGGHRADRPPVHRQHAHVRAGPPRDPDRPHPAPPRTRPADRRPRGPYVAGGPGGRGEGSRPARSARRQDRQPRPGLPADAPLPGRRAHPGRSPRRHDQGHPPLRPPPGILVPPRPPDHLARRARRACPDRGHRTYPSRTVTVCTIRANWGGAVMMTLRVVDRMAGAEHAVELQLAGPGPVQSASVRFGFELSARDREDLRWYLEDYLQYPVDPAPEIARAVEVRLAALGTDLFQRVFRTNDAARELWFALKRSLSDARVEVATGVDAAAGIPWELLRDPDTDGALALRAGAFVRALAETAAPLRMPPASEKLRVLLVICRPGGRADVPFRSVASHLVRLSSGAREAFQLDVLRPPTFAQLARVLQAARVAGAPYHVVHFDGHGAWLDDDAVAAGTVGGLDRQRFSVLSPTRSGSHGYLVFEDPSVKENQQLVDGPALGQLLVDGGVPVLVLNACRSAHAGLATKPEPGADLDAHGRVRAYGSLAQEVMDAGVAGVVAMGYNVYVVTAAQFIADVYASLLEGRELGQAVTAARRQLAASPLRQVSLEPRPLQDWLVPVVFEAAPLALRAAPQAQPERTISLNQAEAGQERAGLDSAQLAAPDVGFYGRDETLLALDRAFDTARIVLLHAWAGAGKTTTSLEFARWYELTGAVEGVLFTPFTRHLPLARLLDQIGDPFGPALAQQGIEWATLDDAQRRKLALHVLVQVPVLWVWDNVEPVAGFPAGTQSAWTQAEQDELVSFLRDLAKQGTGCKVLLTSRRDEQAWLGDLPARVALPPMPMLERLELAKAVAGRQTGTGERFLEVQDWRPLLEFTQGNPLTVTVLTRQALRDGRTSKAQIEAFVSDLRSGAATVTDDSRQGRGASLAASLDYGFEHAFTDPERAQLALLALFQGFVAVDALLIMGNSNLEGGPVAALAGLDRERGIALLDRAAETGLLTIRGHGYYAVHPAIPWHLRRLFEHHYGPPASPAAQHPIHAWTAAISAIGEYWTRRYASGHTDAIGALGAEEDNLLRARQLVRQNGWWDLVIGTMQGLRVLYENVGRAVEWRRLITELTPDLADPGTDGPLPGREQQWVLHTEYRVSIARQAREWAHAQSLQEAIVDWRRHRAVNDLAAEPETLSDIQRNKIRNLAVAIEGLGHILREQDKNDCLDPYLEAMSLFQRSGDRRAEGVVAYNLGHAYTEIPGLRDLDQAERWYRRRLELTETHDTRGRANVIGQLGSVAYERFLAGREAGEPLAKRAHYLQDAVTAYEQALQLLPTADARTLGVIHNQLGNIYGTASITDRALHHYRQSIQHKEQRDDRYGAGTSRLNAAIALGQAMRNREALPYAQAALRDLEAVGSGAAAKAGEARQLIAELEQLLQHESEGSTDDGR